MEDIDNTVDIEHCTMCNRVIVGDRGYRLEHGVVFCSRTCLDEYWEDTYR